MGRPPPDHPPRAVTPEMIERADRRISMGCLDRASCPAQLRSVPVEDRALPDPELLDDAGFRAAAEELARRIDRLREELRSPGAS